MAEKDMIGENMVVSMAYKLTVDGEVLDEAGDNDAIDFLTGHHNIISGLEDQLSGMKKGESKSVVVAPKDGYGLVDESAIEEVSMDEFDKDVTPEVGMELQMKDSSGHEAYAKVVSIGEKNAKVDFNHPLAGKELNFEIKIVNLREATSEEFAHGHVHSPGHHH